MGSSSKQTTMLAAAAAGALWLAAVSPTPAQAAGDKGEAKEACTDLMGDRGMKNVDVDEANKNKKGNVVVEADATKRGNDRSVDCVYNPDTGNARIRK